MRSSVSVTCLLLSLSLCTSACATAPVNGIGRGGSPRIQAAVIIALATLEAGIAITAAREAQTGKTTCTRKADAGEGWWEPKNDCTGPLENAVGAAMFGIGASVDLGMAVYQLVTNRQVFYRPFRPTALDDPRIRPWSAMAAPAEQAPVQQAYVLPAYVPALPFDRDACIRNRIERQREALLVQDLDERGRLLMALPRCQPIRL